MIGDGGLEDEGDGVLSSSLARYGTEKYACRVMLQQYVCNVVRTVAAKVSDFHVLKLSTNVDACWCRL